jgi:hypothetical protein
MEATDDQQTIAGPCLDLVTEPGPRPRHLATGRGQRGPQHLPREAAERDHYAQAVGKELELTHQPRPAGIAFARCRRVRRRSASHGGNQTRVDQLLAVIGTN